MLSLSTQNKTRIKMKKTITIAMMLIGMVASAQSLKGYELGTPAPNNEKYNENTSVGGVDGVLWLYTLNDGRIYLMGFVPSNNGKDTSRMYSSDFNAFKAGVEKNYGIKLKFTKSTTYGDNGFWSYESNDVKFILSYEINTYMDKPVKSSFIITSKSLSKINEKEEAEKASAEF